MEQRNNNQGLRVNKCLQQCFNLTKTNNLPIEQFETGNRETLESYFAQAESRYPIEHAFKTGDQMVEYYKRWLF